jgi:hypothetical protein
MSYMGLLSKQAHLLSRFPEVEITFTLREFVVRVLSRLDLLFSYPVLILALLGMPRNWRHRRPSEALVLITFGVGLAYCVVFYRSVFIHFWHTYYLSAPIAIFAALGVRCIVNREDSDELTGNVSNRAALMFVMLLVLWGMFPRLSSMHQMQTRLLPGNQTEQATLLRDVGLKLGDLSQSNSVILSNLPNKARKEVGYYASRKIIWQIDSVELLKKQLSLINPNTGLFFFYWLPENSTTEAMRLFDYIKTGGIARLIPVDGYQFVWLKLTRVDP